MNIPALYGRFIQWIGDGTGLPDAILHLHAGLALMIVGRLVTRRSLGTFVPFAFAVVGEFANELLDFLHYGWRAEDTYGDIANTLFWPLVISLGVRFRPLVEGGNRRDHRDEGDADASEIG